MTRFTAQITFPTKGDHQRLKALVVVYNRSSATMLHGRFTTGDVVDDLLNERFKRDRIRMPKLTPHKASRR